MPNFYILDVTTYSVEVMDILYKHIECPDCGLRPAGRVGTVEIKIEPEEGTFDIFRGAGIFVRKNVIDILSKAKLTGWRSGDVRLHESSSSQIKEFQISELIIIGMTQNYSLHVGIDAMKSCNTCGYKKFAYPDKGLKMPIECWDRNDIFCIAEYPGIVVVTEAFKIALEENNISGIELNSIDEWYPPY